MESGLGAGKSWRMNHCLILDPSTRFWHYIRYDHGLLSGSVQPVV